MVSAHFSCILFVFNRMITTFQRTFFYKSLQSSEWSDLFFLSKDRENRTLVFLLVITGHLLGYPRFEVFSKCSRHDYGKVYASEYEPCKRVFGFSFRGTEDYETYSSV